jgi:glutamyl-tRNA synthetase
MATFNYGFARHEKGKFIVRVEDTDQKRNVKDAEQAIFDGLKWIGLSWDEGADIGGPFGPYRQSERLDTYKEKVQELVKKGMAYEEEGAIRFKNPGLDVSWDDMVRGNITFPGGEVTDFVIMKSDGFPTYNFGVVIDDISMEITHVIRGEEHISNTPKQIALYKAFGVKPPIFGHLPTLRNADRKKLSKRKDPVDLRIYMEQGYLPEALINFLFLLGWSHPEGKEIFDLEEFVRLFDMKRVRPAGPIFDMKKLDWINGEYIRQLTDTELTDKIYEFEKEKLDKEVIAKTVPLIKDRIAKLSDYNFFAGFFFEERQVDKTLLGEIAKEHLENALKTLENISEWKKETIDEKLMNLVKEKGYKTGDFFMDLRIAITGSKFTPPINDSLVILGKDETIKRIKKVI